MRRRQSITWSAVRPVLLSRWFPAAVIAAVMIALAPDRPRGGPADGDVASHGRPNTAGPVRPPRAKSDINPPQPQRHSAPMEPDAHCVAGQLGWIEPAPGTSRIRITTDPERKYPVVRTEEFWVENPSPTGGLSRFRVAIEMVGDHIVLNAGPGTTGSSLDSRLPAGYSLRRSLLLDGRFLVAFDGTSPDALPRALADLAHLGSIEPDGYVETSALPNDPMLAEQWALGEGPGGVRAASGWDRSTGSADVVVAVIDTGIDHSHPDLAPNLAVNPGETGNGRETNGVDDDGNGFIDDWRGWDFVNDDNDPMDDRESGGTLVGHGTHVAGIIGAAGNNGIGIAGVAWDVSLLPVKALDRNGRGTWSDIAEALAYAAARGADISNNAYGTWVAPSTTIADAVVLTRDAGMLFVASAGNGDYPGNGPTIADDLDLYPYYPASFDIENILCVSAHGADGNLALFSNFGLSGADLTAPGVDIVSTRAGGGYTRLSGTSMSSAHVSGAAALALARGTLPGRSGLQSTVLAGAGRGPAYRSLLRWAGRLDIGRSTALAGYPSADHRIAAGSSHFLQVRPDGTVAGWGRAGFLGLGESAGDPTIVPTPRTVGAFDDAIGVAAVGFASYILTRSGEVWVAGQVRFTGTAPVVSHDDFVRVATIPGAIGITGHGGGNGPRHENIAVLDDQGRIWMSGSNAHRQLGAGVDASVPYSADFSVVPGLPPAVDVDVHGGTAFAVDGDGVVWHWGFLPSSAAPTQLPGTLPPLLTIRSDYPGTPLLCGVSASGAALAIDPIFGTPTLLPSTGAVALPIAMAQGLGVDGSGFGLVLADGTIAAGVPAEINDTSHAVFSGATGLAIRSDGTSFSWGSKEDGLRGIGIYQFRPGAAPLQRLPRTERAYSGGQGLAVLGDDGFLRGVRYAESFTPPASIPRFPLFLGAIAPGGGQLAGHAEGFAHALLAFSDGSLFGAGENFAGQLGALPISTVGFQPLPFPQRAVSVAAGYAHSIVLDANGDVWTAGDNSAGQLGTPGQAGGGTFRRVPALGNIIKIASDGFIASYALDAAGILWRWGDDRLPAPAALAIAPGPPNVALRKPVVASGPVFSPVYPAENINDGDPATFTLPTAADTLGFTYAIDLLGAIELDRIILRNRLDGGGAQERLSNYRVSILDATPDGLPGPPKWSADIRTDGSNSGPGGQDVLMAADDPDGTFSGRFIRIENLGGAPYNPQIAEVEAYGRAEPLTGSRIVDFALGDFAAGGPQDLVIATADGRIQVYERPLSSAGGPAPSRAFHLANAVSVAVGIDHGVVSDAAGRVFAWGDNSAGQLGTGSFDQPARDRLVQVAAAGNVSSVLAHGRSSFAVGRSGRIWRWGQDVDLTNVLDQDVATQTFAVGLSNLVFDSGNPGDDWWTRNFTDEQLSDDDVSGTESDPDADGISNLLEYALDTNPFIRDVFALFFGFSVEEIADGGSGSADGPAAAGLEPGQRHAVLRLRRGAKRGDLDYRFEVSEDLIDWRSGSDAFFVVVDNPALLMAYDQEPVDETRPRFYRLSVRFRTYQHDEDD